MKSGLALLLGSPKGLGKSKPKPGADKPMGDGDGDEPDDMGGGSKERAARDFFERGQSGDFKGAAEAAQRLYDACSMGESEPDEDDGEA